MPAEALDDGDRQTFECLLDAFRNADDGKSGRMSREDVVRLLGRLGFRSTDAGQLLDASGSCPNGEVDYEGFLLWLVGGAGARTDVLDAGAEPAPVSPISPTCGFGHWLERAARLLEARGEADFVQKRLMAAQVRAHLRRVSEDDAEPEEDGSVVAGGRSREATSQAAIGSARTRKRSRSPLPSRGATQAPTLRWDGPALLQRFLREGPKGLPREYVEEVLEATLAELPRSRPRPLVRLRIPEASGGRIVVVGDTHGQLQDVLLIMLLHGVPSAKNVYLFNGDVADRGPHACEIFLLIFAFFLGDPRSVILTRGNHEDEHMNMMSADSGGGFFDECIRKYGEPMYWNYVEVFKLLPLAAVVNGEVFVVHGGLPGGPPPGLDAVDAIAHTAYCCPEPNAETAQERLFLDLLWSDPMESPGCEPNPRGSGTLWGPDVTKAFLAKNGLRWMIRSHELPWDGERGWMEHHLGLVFTVFSASNYCGYEVNWGSVALLTLGADGKVEQALREHNIASLEVLHEVSALPEGPLREERCREIGLSWVDSDRIAVGERRVKLALRRLAGIVLEFKPELWKRFREKDKGNVGTIPREVWVDCLVAVCGEELPWEEACKCWEPGPPRSAVDYRRFLGRFRVVLSQERWCGWKSLVIADVYEELLSRHATAQEMIQTFDPSGDGVVSVEDFMEVMHECSGGCLSEPQIAALTRTVFSHSFGKGLRVGNFLERFTLALHPVQGHVAGRGGVPDGALRARAGPARQAHRTGACPRRPPASALPSERRGAGPGNLAVLPPAPDPAMPGEASGPPPVPAAPLFLGRAASAAPAPAAAPLASSVSGVLAVPPPPLTLARAVSAVPTAPAPLGREPSSVLLKAFELFDDSGDGLLQIDEFVRHLQALPGIGEVRHEGRPLDEAALRELAMAIADGCPGASDGTINLLQFSRAFAVVDASDSKDLADDLHEHILTFLWRHQHALRSSCAERDLDGLGQVSKRDFSRVLEAVNFCTAKPARHLTRMQMGVLVESIAEEDGRVEYEAFLSSFEVEAD